MILNIYCLYAEFFLSIPHQFYKHFVFLEIKMGNILTHSIRTQKKYDFIYFIPLSLDVYSSMIVLYSQP